MKKNLLFSVLCLLLISFSFNVNAQIGQNSRAQDEPIDTDDTSCEIYDVSLEITDVEWNAKIGEGGYHAVYIDFIKPSTFNTAYTTEPYTCDIMVNLYSIDDLPVKFFFETNILAPVVGVYDVQGNLDGFRVFPDPHTGGGVTSTVGVMGRVSNIGTGFRPCVQVISTNRAGEDCTLSNEMDVYCEDYIRPRIAQIVEQDIKTYPNPAQNNIFIEANNLDIEEISVMNLYGQTLNHRVSIRYGIDRIQINTAQLESGIYLIALETTNGTVVKKIMVQKN